MFRRLVFAIAISLAAGTVAPAQLPPQPPPVSNPMGLGQGDPQERAACHPDVMRFCKQMIKEGQEPDTFVILGCLQDNRTRISNACQQVLASHGV
jgi:hypothetical protein